MEMRLLGGARIEVRTQRRIADGVAPVDQTLLRRVVDIG